MQHHHRCLQDPESEELVQVEDMMHLRRQCMRAQIVVPFGGTSQTQSFRTWSSEDLFDLLPHLHRWHHLPHRRANLWALCQGRLARFSMMFLAQLAVETCCYERTADGSKFFGCSRFARTGCRHTINYHHGIDTSREALRLRQRG